MLTTAPPCHTTEMVQLVHTDLNIFVGGKGVKSTLSGDLEEFTKTQTRTGISHFFYIMEYIMYKTLLGLIEYFQMESAFWSIFNDHPDI